MKRIVMIVLLVPVLAIAQKQPKPNINKALNSWKTGKVAEAKEMIDLATTYEKTMDDPKTWYYRGLIYASIDTASDASIKNLSDEAFKIALESFQKSDELNKGSKNELFIQDASGLPITKAQHMQTWTANYINKGAGAYQEDDLEGALANFEKVQQINPKDTTSFFYAGFVANGLEKYDLALKNFRAYIDNGGTSSDALLSIYQIYSGPKEDKEKALAIAQEGKQKYPDNKDFPKVEIGLLIDLGKIDQAKSGLEAAIKSEPDNKILHFYLGYVNSSLNNTDAAKKTTKMH
ncbi:MAG: tetratricopeptide repeat protein [Bacteroidia bacterium]|nr:tetratricopeptide repeat protein [Bacteroidia bacterium]